MTLSYSFVFFYCCLASIGSYAQKALTIPTESNTIYDLHFSPKGDAIFVADNSDIKIFSSTSMQLLGELKGGHSKAILSIDLSKDSTLLVSGGKDSTIVVWNLITKKVLKKLPRAKGMVTSLSLSPNQNFIAYGSTDHKAYIYDLVKDKLVSQLDEFKDDITVIKFSNNGAFLAAAGGKIFILYDGEGKKITTLKKHTDIVRDFAFSHDQTRLISCGDDGRVVIWNLQNPSMAPVINGSKKLFTWNLCVDFSANDDTYALGDISGSIRIRGSNFNYRSSVGLPVHRIRFMPSNSKYITVCAATLGKGALLYQAKDMKMSNRK